LKYDLKIQKNAQKSLSKISKPFQTKIIDKIYALSNDPYYNAKKLTGREAYRIRIGNYRVIYEIKNSELVILVVHIGHRKDIYSR
jgi:mRNA interferase RelE/StbE